MTLPPLSKTKRSWFSNLNHETQKPNLFVSFGLILLLTVAPAALATAYTPNNPSRPSGNSGSSGVRTGSCGVASKGSLTALAPLGHMGRTASTHPTFAWYVPDEQPYPIEFRLYRYNSNGRLMRLQQIQLESKKGIMPYPLPHDQPGLIVGQTYLWQVALRCNLSRPSEDQILRTDVEVTAIPATLQSSLAKTSDRLQRAKLYADAGFWYDAIAEALTTTKTKPFVIELLEDLAKLEPPGTPEKPGQQYTRLKQVIEIERQQ